MARRDRLLADVDPGAYPRLAGVGPRWAALTAANPYRRGLEALFAGILATRAG